MLRIAMDTACDLVAGWKEKYQIDEIPINIIMDDKSYRQGIDIGYNDFYAYVENSGKIPSTSQPTPYQFEEFYKTIAKPGDTVLSIHITEKLSGTMDSARRAAEQLKDKIKIIPFDSASGTICVGMMCKEAREMEKSGKPLDDILKRLEFMKNNMQLMAVLDTLRYAQMSGRIKYMQAALASVLQVKPIIYLKNGIIEMGEKVRSRTKAVDRMIELLKVKMQGRAVHAAVVHAHDATGAEEAKRKVAHALNCVDVYIAELSISLATHFGPGAIAVACYPDSE